MTNIFHINDQESAALNLLQFLIANGCSIALDEDAHSALTTDDLAGYGDAAKAEAYLDAIKAVDGYASIRYASDEFRGWVQFAIGWGNQDWEEVPDWSCPRDDDKLCLVDIWHGSYQNRIGDKLAEELYNRIDRSVQQVG